MVEWRVWLADGSIMDSSRHTWAEVPDRILVVRWWDAEKKQKGVHWGDSNYGLPGTWKGGEIVDDATFGEVLAAAQAAVIPPSKG